MMVILMYHAFGGPDESPSRFVVPVGRFSRQMALLRWLGYQVLSLEEYLQYRRDHRLPPARSVVITMDDGYLDNRSLAYPVLRHHGYPATIFLVTDRMGGMNDWAPGTALSGRALLSWADAHEMQQGGIQFGAHTRTHPRLTSLSPDAARGEILGSHAEVSRALGGAVRLFAYPFGDCDTTTESIAAQAGFWASCGTRSGKNTSQTPLHNLRRTEIHGTDGLIAFALKLWSGERHVLGRGRRYRARRWSRSRLLTQNGPQAATSSLPGPDPESRRWAR